MAEPEIFRMLRVLAPERRQRIMVQLGEGPQSAASVAEALSTPLSTVRSNLQVLEELGVVTAVREGRSKIYRRGENAQVLRIAGRPVLSIKSREGGEFVISRPEEWLKR